MELLSQFTLFSTYEEKEIQLLAPDYIDLSHFHTGVPVWISQYVSVHYLFAKKVLLKSKT